MIKKKLLTFKQNASGNIAIMTAVVMPVLVAALGFGGEVAIWYHDSLQLQQAADKSVYAAAIDLRAGASSNTVLTTARDTAQINGFVPNTPSTGQPDSLAVFNPPISGAYTGNANAIQVVFKKYIPLNLSSLFMSAPVQENAIAVALISTADSACIIALSTTASGAISLGGNANLSVSGCNFNSNSTAADGVLTSGSAKLAVDCIVSVGGVSLNGGATTLVCPNAFTNAPPIRDPYASLPVPTSVTIRSNSNASVLQPGVYTNGLNLTGTKTLQPGVYIVTGGSVNVGANASITGSGVTIYVANGVNVSMNANGYVNLSAPTSGTYSGVLFFGARDGTGSITMNGTASSLLTGALYFPNQNISYNGNFSGNSGCMRVVAKTISWAGNTSISQDCSAFGIANIPSQQPVTLVE